MKNNDYAFSTLKTRKRKINIKNYSSYIKLVLLFLSFSYVYLRIDKKISLISRMSEIKFIIKGITVPKIIFL